MKAAWAALLFSGLVASLFADDLVTRDGTIYRNYKVIDHDPGFITIMYADSGGKIPLSELPPDLQKQYGYDSKTSDQYAASYSAQEKADRDAAQQASAARLTQEAKQNEIYIANLAAAKAWIPSVTQPPRKHTPPTREQIEARINYLQSDINFMQGQENQTFDNGHYLLTRNGVKTVSKGGYADMIAQEQDEIAELQQQLQKAPSNQTAYNP